MSILESWLNTEGNVNTTEDLLSWVRQVQESTYVSINECSMGDDSFWYYNSKRGEIINRTRSFFSITGIQHFESEILVCEQPIIVQPEIGYLGIICKQIDGVLNFLMQAKIEPGNVNCVQISPTIQATKSNFLRVHGGKSPAYLSYFEDSSCGTLVYDQIQSEQAGRFYKKRNRNMILQVDGFVDVQPNFRWMTLGQIKKLMEIDNLVNMDTRTVLSGIPIVPSITNGREYEEARGLFGDASLFESIFGTSPLEDFPRIYRQINDYKMFHMARTRLIPLSELADWVVDERGITCSKQADFMVRYYDIQINGREVQKWNQPLFKAIGVATFALVTKAQKGIRRFLVKLRNEIGSFDMIEIGPSIQWEPSHNAEQDDCVGRAFRKCLNERKGILFDAILSEEGGRFFHEQNRNVIVEIGRDELDQLPEGYLWVNGSTLFSLVQVNNCLNIQLRNLLSLLQL